MSIGSRIREARKATKLTQHELAAKVGMKQGSLSELETGESEGTTLVATFAAVLGVNALWLETGKGPREQNTTHEPQVPSKFVLTWVSDEEQEILVQFRQCTDQSKRLARDTLRNAEKDPVKLRAVS